MSVARSIAIECDAPGCYARKAWPESGDAAETLTFLRDHARRQGWARDAEGADYCPEHAATASYYPRKEREPDAS